MASCAYLIARSLDIPPTRELPVHPEPFLATADSQHLDRRFRPQHHHRSTPVEEQEVSLHLLSRTQESPTEYT